MIRVSKLRNGQSPTRGLAVFVVAWLNLVIAPCAMAAAGEHACAHCPPEAGSAMSDHHGHAMKEVQNPCATIQADCCEHAATTVDNRGADNSAARKAQSDCSVEAPAYAELQAAPRATARIASDPPELPSYAAPPRHVLNCVYLD